MARLTLPSSTYRTWWFAVFVAAPAVTLAFLGFRSVRATDIEQAQQLREEQRQVASLVDAALGAALDRVAADVDVAIDAARHPSQAPSAADRDVVPFVQDASGAIAFPNDRIFFGPVGHVPAASAWRPPGPDVLALIDEAQAMEAQGRRDDARARFERVGTMEPLLGDWVTLRLLTERAAAGEVRAVAELADERLAETVSRAPSGAPVAVVATAMSAIVPEISRARFRALATRTLEELRAGRWWLSVDQRRAYDAELRRMLVTLGGQAVEADDARVAELTTVDARLRRMERGGNVPSDRSVWLPGDGPAALAVWSTAAGTTGVRSGAVITPDRFRYRVAAVVNPIVAGRGFDVALVDRTGTSMWGATDVAVWQSVSLETMPGWRITFTARAPQEGRRLIRYATVLLPAVALGVGLLSTVVMVRRELALARLQSTLVANVTHEFKSPITSIRLLIERLASGRLAADDPPARYLAAVDAEAARLEGLVNRLLESQELQSGQKAYAFEPTSVVSLVRSVVDRWRPQVEAKRMRLVLSTPDALDATIDPDAIADVVGNLIDNAIKYSPAETAVTVSLSRVGGRFDLEVADEGVGVDPAEAERIFDAFYRGRRGDRENVHGTGLGLSLVRAAALAHGGSISVRPNLERGSRFTLSLPLVPFGSATAGQGLQPLASVAAEVRQTQTDVR